MDMVPLLNQVSYSPVKLLHLLSTTRESGFEATKDTALKGFADNQGRRLSGQTVRWVKWRLCGAGADKFPMRRQHTVRPGD